MRSADTVVIGAGFGGLGAALRLAELGAKVVLCETLRYPGGCASTFSRSGYRFEAGATLFSGLGEGQLFSKWNEAFDLGLRFDLLDPLVELRTGDWSLPTETPWWIVWPRSRTRTAEPCVTSSAPNIESLTRSGSSSMTRRCFHRSVAARWHGT